MNKIAITGGKGFLGKSVALHLHSLGMVTALDSSMYDLRSYDQTNQMYKDIKPNIVVHLAATVGGIGANKDNPGLFIEENLIMGYNTIKLAKEHGVEKFIMLGTVCAYPKHCKVPFKEEDIWNGYPEETNAPYGIAKKTLMQMIQSYGQQYNFSGLNLIPVNMYGPCDNFNESSSHVIPALILKFQKAIDDNHSNVEIWGTGKASREFLYVDDCADAIKKAIQRWDSSMSGQLINVGTGKEITIKQLALIIQKQMGHRGKIKFNKNYPDGQPRRRLDVSKAEHYLGFRAKINLEEGLKKTIDWFRNDYYNS